jgi:hypothetical protein
MAAKKPNTAPRRVRKPYAIKATPRPSVGADTETKKDIVLRLLRRQNGASITELTEATSWQEHSVRGFLTATIKKKLELPLVSTKEAGKDRRYHIGALKPAKE